MLKIDKKDCQILDLLQQDCRMSLTAISKKIGISVDAVKKRINKMLKYELFYPKIQIRPRSMGFNDIVDVRIKLTNYEEKEVKNFIKYLTEHPNVAEVFSHSGAWNFSIVIVAKDLKHLAQITAEIRNKYGKIIGEWSESLTTVVYKFEDYKVEMLINSNPEKILNDKKISESKIKKTRRK